MIKLSYKQINNTHGLTEIAQKIAQEHPSLLNVKSREITITEYKYLSILKNDLIIAGNTNKGAYNVTRNKMISYAVRNNIDCNEMVQFVGSEKFRPYYEKRYIYKQALIKVIKSAMKNLPKFKSYAKKLSEEGRNLEFDIILKQKYQTAEKEFNELCQFYEKKTSSVLLHIRETLYKDKFKFRYNIKENEALIEAALKMFQFKEKMNSEAIDKVKNFPSLAKYWISCKYDFQSLSSSQLVLFMKFLKSYVNEYHQDDLKSEQNLADCKKTMKYYKSKNPGHVTDEERKQKVFELFDIHKNYSKVAELLENTPFETSRQTISKWIKPKNVKIS